MCGVWGIVGLADDEFAKDAALAMHHRGPDDSGTYVATQPGAVSLTNCRLSIIDLSEAGHQPMTNEDGSIWLVYNGEMYNFAGLRQELIERGHTFTSNTDTEVVIHGYEEWGVKCLDRFRGMFAFGLWDAKRQRLFAARDRLGIKPLLYTQQGDNFLFGSEIKTLLSSGLIEPRLNKLALHHYLSFYAIPTPYTILEGVHALPAGHYLTYESGKLTIEGYWDVPAASPLDMDLPDIKAELRRLLEESVRLRMIADVPVGAFLSGGIDSSAVVALMTRISGERLKTFSIGFGREGAGIDERSDARVIAELYETDHHEVIISGRDVAAQLEHIVAAMDQPSGDGLNTYFVSQATTEHVKVALSGLGGDELFAGYPQFGLFEQLDRYERLWNGLPAPLRSVAGAGLGVVPRGRKFLDWMNDDFMGRYGWVRVLYDAAGKAALYNHDLREALADAEPSLAYLHRFVHPGESGNMARLTRLELKNYMAHTLLRDTDVMSMAHSLEVRVPLIDHELVEFAVRIPPELKLRDGHGKWILIESLRDVLPAEVTNRPKRGFEMPVGEWMRNDLKPVLDEALSEKSVAARGLFDPAEVSHIYAAFQRGEGPYMRVWSLATLELWMRHFLPSG